MIDTDSLDCIAKADFLDGFCRPHYDKYCFSKVPEKIQKLFLKEKYEKVVLFLIDGFGWRFFEKYADRYPFLKRFVDEGNVCKITSQFPSTTAAHLTSLSTGLEVGQTGIYEWFQYDPITDRIIAPLLYSFAGDKQLSSLKAAGVDSSKLFPWPTIYQKFQEMGIDSYIVQPEKIAHSPYSERMYRGTHAFPYRNFAEGLQRLSGLIKQKEKGYFYVYYSEIDSVAHHHGIDSPLFDQAVTSCFDSIENLIWKDLPEKTACVVIADHGMIEINPKEAFYLNQQVPQILGMIQKNRAGQPLVPAGSCRDFFLHIEPSFLEEAEQLLKSRLQDRAVVVQTKLLIKEKMFGSLPPSPAFLERVGNLAILPKQHHTIWWYEKDRFEQKFHAMHGGLTRQEMETIQLVISK